MNNNLVQELKSRDLVIHITNEKMLINEIKEKRITLYCGFDPTSDSLHLGHLIPLLCLKRFQLLGHKIIILIGGATGSIGDPSFKKIERDYNSFEKVKKWKEKIKNQIFYLLKNKSNNITIVDNYNWFCSMNILYFLNKVGRNFSINQMINKEIIKRRLSKENYGLSFTEFSYNLLQSYDFAFLYKKYGAILQIGGSDQWGNITSGISLIRKLYKKRVFGLTLPIITKSDGTKFSKTENNSIWIDPNKTSPYKFYQFWINTRDSDVYRFLKFFTFLDLSFIYRLEKDQCTINKKPKAQYILAENVTKIVHGEKGLESAKRITNSLFNSKLENLTKDDLSQLSIDGIPSLTIKENINLQEVLVKTKLSSSKKHARYLIKENAIMINGKIQKLINYEFSNLDRLYGKYTILCRGKKHYFLLNWKL